MNELALWVVTSMSFEPLWVPRTI